MEKEAHFDFTPGVVGYPLLFVLLIWIVYWIEVRFGFDFTSYGIFPRSPQALPGIFVSPFVHSGMKHLFHNSIPLLVLSMSLFYFYRELSWKVLGYGLLLSGLMTWGIGRPAFHIGASGIIYLLAGFLFFKGIFSRYYRLVAVSLIVVFLYGGLLWYVTPIDPEVSWEGHLSGLISGLILAIGFKKTIPQAPKYEWERDSYREEDDPFMRHFDEKGNFIEDSGEEGPRYVYHYKEEPGKDQNS